MPALIYCIAALLASTGVFLIVGAICNEHCERRDRARYLSVGDQAEAWLRREQPTG